MGARSSHQLQGAGEYCGGRITGRPHSLLQEYSWRKWELKGLKIAVIRKRELHRGTVMGKGDKGKGGSGTNFK